MDEKQLKEQLEQLKAKLEEAATAKAKAEIETQMKSVNEKLEAIEKAQKEAGNDRAKLEDMDTRLKSIDAHLAEQKKFSEKKAEAKTFTEALNDAIAEKSAEIKTILDNGGKQSGPLVLNVKAAVDMTAAGNFDAVGSASHVNLTHNTGIISTIRQRVLTYLSNVSVGSISPSRPYAMWVEELDEQGTPIFIGEGDPKTQLSVRYEEREKKAKKIGVYGKVTTEMLRYTPQLISYIQNNLLKRMDITTEDQLFAGDDTGDNLKGIKGYATAFAAGSLANTIADANDFDVIEAIALQVILAKGSPNAVFVHPGVVSRMKLSKGTDGHYVMPPFAAVNGTSVSGLKVIPTTGLAADEFVGGDMSVVNVQFTDNASIQIGLDGNDFTNNKKTILVEQELVQYVSANDTACLVKGTFAAAKALLDPSVVDA